MSVKSCPGCGREVSTDADVCTFCGHSYPTQAKTNRILGWITILVILGVIGYLVVR